MSQALERYSALSLLSDRLLAEARHEDLEECLRLLAVYCAEYRSAHGIRSFDGAMSLLSLDELDDSQAKALGDGFEMIVGMLGFLREARSGA